MRRWTLLLLIVPAVLFPGVSGKPAFTAIPTGMGSPGLDCPTAIVHHPSGLWVVSDTGNDRLLLLNEDLTLNASLDGVLERPRGVAVDSRGLIWVADSGKDRLVILDSSLSVVKTEGSRGEGSGEFNTPWGVASDGRGRVAVADAVNRRVQVFREECGGSPLIIGEWGMGPGQFDGPLDVAFDSAGRLHVVDTYLEAEGYIRRVQVFNSDLTHNQTIWEITNRLRFTRPVGIGAGAGGLIAVADQFADRIYFFDALGEHMGGIGFLEGQPSLETPVDVAFAPGSGGGLSMAILEKEPGRVRTARFSIAESSLVWSALVVVLAFAGRLGPVDKGAVHDGGPGSVSPVPDDQISVMAEADEAPCRL